MQKDVTHFDFILTPKHPTHCQDRVSRDVDARLMTPGLPAWTKADTGLRRIALTDPDSGVVSKFGLTPGRHTSR